MIEAIVDSIRRKLQTDCYLNPNSAYDWFKSRVDIKLSLHDSGMTLNVDHAVEAIRGDEPYERVDVLNIEENFETDAAPPNEVRIETGQPVPVLTTDKTGKPAIKGVRYTRKDLQKTAALLVFFAAFGLSAKAQSAAVPAAPVKPTVGPPTLTYSEQLAIQSVAKEEQDLITENNDLQNRRKAAIQREQTLEADIEHTHPGYHLDPRAGQLIKNAAVPAKTAAPATK